MPNHCVYAWVNKRCKSLYSRMYLWASMLGRVPRVVLLIAIRIYQRYLSPYKGFSCAYHRHTGFASCSHLGYRAVRRHGIMMGLTLLKQRTYLCGVIQRRHYHLPKRSINYQRGDCDPGCDLNWDMPNVCDITNLCDPSCACDWSDRKKKKDGRDKTLNVNESDLYIPCHPKLSKR